jgi:hypothetical protein
MSKVQANGITINYEQRGTGEPLVLIPYLAADHASHLPKHGRVQREDLELPQPPHRLEAPAACELATAARQRRLPEQGMFAALLSKPEETYPHSINLEILDRWATAPLQNRPDPLGTRT